MTPKVMLTKDGPELSKIVQGFWRLSDWDMTNQEIVQLIEMCLENGITTFDHADIYGEYSCETLFGKAIADSSIDRASYQLVTKCGIKLISDQRPDHKIKSYDTSETHIIQSIDNSLKALKTDYIDLLLIHRPDDLMDGDEIAHAFSTLKESGKVLYFGVSNFQAHQFDLLESRLDFPLVTNQIEYSVLNMDVQTDGTLDYCQQHRIKPMAWSPFAGGQLFSRQDDYKNLMSVLMKLGNEHGGASVDQIALAFILKHPVGFIPVLGTGKMKRIESAIKSLEIDLSREQWYSIWEAAKGCEVP